MPLLVNIKEPGKDIVVAPVMEAVNKYVLDIVDVLEIRRGTTVFVADTAISLHEEQTMSIMFQLAKTADEYLLLQTVYARVTAAHELETLEEEFIVALTEFRNSKFDKKIL